MTLQQVRNFMMVSGYTQAQIDEAEKAYFAANPQEKAKHNYRKES